VLTKTEIEELKRKKKHEWSLEFSEDTISFLNNDGCIYEVEADPFEEFRWIVTSPGFKAVTGSAETTAQLAIEIMKVIPDVIEIEYAKEKSAKLDRMLARQKKKYNDQLST